MTEIRSSWQIKDAGIVVTVWADEPDGKHAVQAFVGPTDDLAASCGFLTKLVEQSIKDRAGTLPCLSDLLRNMKRRKYVRREKVA